MFAIIIYFYLYLSARSIAISIARTCTWSRPNSWVCIAIGQPHAWWHLVDLVSSNTNVIKYFFHSVFVFHVLVDTSASQRNKLRYFAILPVWTETIGALIVIIKTANEKEKKSTREQLICVHWMRLGARVYSSYKMARFCWFQLISLCMHCKISYVPADTYILWAMIFYYMY